VPEFILIGFRDTLHLVPIVPHRDVRQRRRHTTIPGSDIFRGKLLHPADTESGAWGNDCQSEKKWYTRNRPWCTSPLRSLLDKSWPETSNKLNEVLTVGLTTGQGANWIAQRMMEAVEIPEKRALVIARTEVNRAYREAHLETMRESRAVIGYRRMCYPPTACFACLEMDGEFYEKGESFSDHPNGKCSAVPVTKHFDPINDPNWERGQQWFERQSEETQRKIMGPGRYDLWKKDGVNPRDMVYIKENPFWGGSPTMKTLESIIRSQSIPLSLQNRNSLDISEDVKNEIIENGRKALIFFQHVDPLYEYAKTIPPLSGYQDIFVHGGDTGFMFKDVGHRHNQETYINVNEFADFVKESQVYKGGKIRLISCGTGGETAMTAQWFADAMGVEVLAPTKEANLWKNYLEIFDKDGNPGEWKTFVPRKGTQH